MHSCQIDRHLTEQLQHLLSQALSGTTQSTYAAGVRQYLRFCKQSNQSTMAFFLAAVASIELTAYQAQPGTAPGRQTQAHRDMSRTATYHTSPAHSTPWCSDIYHTGRTRTHKICPTSILLEALGNQPVYRSSNYLPAMYSAHWWPYRHTWPGSHQ